MVSVQSKTVWMKRQQCPCGDWKCFITYEGEIDENNLGSQSIKNDSGPTETMVAPYVGMVFKSDDEAFEYYGNFARKNGFSIRKERSRLSPQLGVYKRDFVCYRSGFAPARKKQTGEHQRDRKSVRCGCDAKMYLSKEVVDGVSQWFVVQFSNVHNHELLEDDQVRLLPAYRKIHEADQERILLLSKAGFPIHRIVKVLELEKGIQGGQLSFLERDVRNFVQNRKKVVQENDALLTEKRESETVDLLEACRANKEADPYFVYDVTVDENDKVENIAWAFGDSVHAYDMFGDVIYFDSTYRSMMYGMLFGAWVGISNHGKLLVFGCALLQDETPRSFAWSLQAFLRFMKGRYPKTIITDVDPGLREAVRSELPNTKHVISLYNILPRTSSWFSLPLGPRWFPTLDLIQISTLLYSFPFAHAGLCLTLEAAFLQEWIVHPHDEVQYMHLKTCLPIEDHARSVLTPFAFNGIQQEMVLAMQYAASEMANGSYLVRHFKKACPPGAVIQELFSTSSKYLLNRWRQESSLFCYSGQSNPKIKDDWYQEFNSLTETLFSEAMLTRQRSEFVHRELTKELRRLIGQVRDMPAVDEVVLNVTLSPTNVFDIFIQQYNDEMDLKLVMLLPAFKSHKIEDFKLDRSIQACFHHLDNQCVARFGLSSDSSIHDKPFRLVEILRLTSNLPALRTEYLLDLSPSSAIQFAGGAWEERWELCVERKAVQTQDFKQKEKALLINEKGKQIILYRKLNFLMDTQGGQSSLMSKNKT
ncbi:putative protein FAR1-RELATED SEQUENCE 10 [Sesamum angolense]|uniref:Protein FAR1-RELATED SEQUENCE n=1 Tax=Sesamum angolense TaxID=2727404 RepID=A0AAE1WSP5_9LAMI|nr:putative protein FAR1-RELATED SEQUENCE 10 [Sesamum angolense]